MAATAAQSWKRFPHYLVAAMAVVVAVNVRFIIIAVSTFPGAAATDDFGTSNHYNAVLAAVAAQDALGWSEQAGVRNAVPVVDLAGADHAPLKGARLTAQADRPLGNLPALDITFHEASAGHFVADRALPAAGQWDLQLRIAQNGHQARVTRRVICVIIAERK